MPEQRRPLKNSFFGSPPSSTSRSSSRQISMMVTSMYVWNSPSEAVTHRTPAAQRQKFAFPVKKYAARTENSSANISRSKECRNIPLT